MQTNTELARQVFDAAERADTATLRSLCADDVGFSTNGGRPMNLEAFLRFNSVTIAAVRNPRYENIVTRETSDGFVEEHDFCATLPDGTEARVPACLVATIVNGKLTSLREYFDSRAAAKVAAAVQTRS
ncbi:MAG: nuclear transport factor 2 family protein [Chloroflexi bacterium]|nr:nuclear transport factor 2 family protein [Chloroflexota bacterium]